MSCNHYNYASFRAKEYCYLSAPTYLWERLWSQHIEEEASASSQCLRTPSSGRQGCYSCRRFNSVLLRICQEKEPKPAINCAESGWSDADCVWVFQFVALGQIYGSSSGLGSENIIFTKDFWKKEPAILVGMVVRSWTSSRSTSTTMLTTSSGRPLQRIEVFVTWILGQCTEKSMHLITLLTASLASSSSWNPWSIILATLLWKIPLRRDIAWEVAVDLKTCRWLGFKEIYRWLQREDDPTRSKASSSSSTCSTIRSGSGRAPADPRRTNMRRQAALVLIVMFNSITPGKQASKGTSYPFTWPLFAAVEIPTLSTHNDVLCPARHPWKFTFESIVVISLSSKHILTSMKPFQCRFMSHQNLIVSKSWIRLTVVLMLITSGWGGM